MNIGPMRVGAFRASFCLASAGTFLTANAALMLDGSVAAMAATIGQAVHPGSHAPLDHSLHQAQASTGVIASVPEPLLYLALGFGLAIFLVAIHKFIQGMLSPNPPEDASKGAATPDFIDKGLQLLIENSPAAVAMLDRQMRYVHVSDRWLTDYGQGDDSIIGKSHYEYFPEILHMERWMNLHRRALSGENFTNYEDYFIRDDGRTEWVKFALHPWRTAEGDIGGLVIFMEVITERKNMEARGQLLMDLAVDTVRLNSVDQILELTLEKICVYFNVPVGHVYVWGQEQGTFHSSGIWYTADARDNFQQLKEICGKEHYKPGLDLAARAYSQRGPVFTRDTPAGQRNPNDPFPLRGAVAIPVFIDNVIIAVLTLFSRDPLDIHLVRHDFLEVVSAQLSRLVERCSYERALAHSNRLNNAVLDSASCLIVATDSEGKILLFNRAAEKALGYDAEEIVEKAMPTLWHDPEELAQRAAELGKLLGSYIAPGMDVFIRKPLTSGSQSQEWTFIRKDGSQFPANLTVTPMRDELGDVAGFLGIAEDMTERKEVERLKAEFVAMVSHELRTPLTSIRGALGLLAGPMADQIPAQLNTLIEIAHKNSERLLLLVNDILDIESISSGQMRFDCHDEDLAAIVAQAVKIYSSYAANYQVSLVATRIDENLRVHVDPDRLMQVLANLISNAAKFSPEGATVEISLIRYGGKARLCVEDHGEGIPEEFQGQLFGRFAQGDSSASRSRGGSGLGLYISKQIVERMGGTIGFESVVGEGSTFWIEMPLIEAGGNAENMPPVAEAAKADLPYVLHMENDAELSDSLAVSLRGKAHIINTATINETRQALAARRFNLLVLDLPLPDGQDFESLKNVAPEPLPPVVIISTREGTEAIEGVSASFLKANVTEANFTRTLMRLIQQPPEQSAPLANDYHYRRRAMAG